MDISDQELLTKIKAEESAAFKILYSKYFPSVQNYILKNSGNEQDAEDIFQESILVLLDKIRQSDFTLTSSLKTYLYAISKNLWLKRLRDSKYVITDFNSQPHFLKIESDACVEDLAVQQSKERLVQNLFQKITANCQRILKAIFYYQQPIEALMISMGWKNKHTAANQKYKCIEQVKREKERDSKK